MEVERVWGYAGTSMQGCDRVHSDEEDDYRRRTEDGEFRSSLSPPHTTL